MQDKLQDLKARLIEANDLDRIGALLYWDQSANMPTGGSKARGRQQGLISRLAHERFIDPAIGQLLDALRPYEESLPYDHDDASLIRVTRRYYERAVRVPSEFTARSADHASEIYQAWVAARPQNDFTSLKPLLQKSIDLSREYAEFFPDIEHYADPHIAESDYGMSARMVRAIFSELREAMVPLVRQILEQPEMDNRFLQRHYPEQAQWDFGLEVIRDLGYDFERGRQDKTPHPFTIKFDVGDVRITTRIREHDVIEALSSTMHEAGHAMYEQGINPAFSGTPLDEGTSAGVHESQSRLWENMVGRNRHFWVHYYPKLQAVFPEQLGDVSLDQFYRGINKVQRGLIRTDADEVTYNLHVMIRFDLELDLLEGTLAVADLPEAWNARYTSDLGVTPPSLADGVLQDIHWFSGLLGGSFQGYTLGNIIGGQIFAKALGVNPQIESDMSQGQFDTLHTWLKERIYWHGSKFTPTELIERVTGQPLTIEPYLNYLRQKYLPIYNLA